jgi:hypothetical protein
MLWIIGRVHDEAHGLALELHRRGVEWPAFGVQHRAQRPFEVVADVDRNLLKDRVALGVLHGLDLAALRLELRAPRLECRMVEREPLVLRAGRDCAFGHHLVAGALPMSRMLVDERRPAMASSSFAVASGSVRMSRASSACSPYLSLGRRFGFLGGHVLALA